MTFIPEWMLNVHPLIVHFPIALLVIAVLTDFLGLILNRHQWLKPASLWLYVLGALGTVGAYLSGKQAADVVNIPPSAFSVISLHADLAFYTMIFFGAYALIRLFFAFKKWDQIKPLAILLFLIASGGLILVQQTAEHGGELVFRYGLGGKAQNTQAQEPLENNNSLNALSIDQNGSWTWMVGKEAALSFRQNFKLLQGNWQDVVLQVVNTSDNKPALNIYSDHRKPFAFTFGVKLENVQLSARVNLTQFEGRFLLIHHVSGPDTYDFLAVEKDRVFLGRKDHGRVKTFKAKDIQQNGWLNLKVVSSKGHYRGYVNDILVVHGHGLDLAAGQTGFAFSGKGAIQIQKIETLSLDTEKTEQMHSNNEHGH